jgi:hypothetical protein
LPVANTRRHARRAIGAASLAAHAVAWLRAHPDSSLTIADIAARFGVPVMAGDRDDLRMAVRRGLIASYRGAGRGAPVVYACRGAVDAALHDQPFGLTQRQAAALDAYVQHGCMKRAADAIGITAHSLGTYVQEARRRMRRAGVVSTGCRVAVLWDRARQAQRSQGATKGSGVA